MIPAALLTVTVIAAAIVITSQQHENSQHTQHRELAYGPQVTLPFTGLYIPYGVAVDTAQACLLRHGATACNCRTRHTTGDGPTCPP